MVIAKSSNHCAILQHVVNPGNAPFSSPRRYSGAKHLLASLRTPAMRTELGVWIRGYLGIELKTHSKPMSLGDYPDDTRDLLVNAENERAPLLPSPEKPERTFREVILVSIPVFSGLACLSALQYEVKMLLQISPGTPQSDVFQAAVAMVYVGILLFRIGHYVVFRHFLPRSRVLISQLCVTASILMFVWMFFVSREDTNIAWVYIAYFLGGVGIGIFESNLFNSISTIGPYNKFWAILGIPIGVNIIAIGAFILLKFDFFPGWIFAATAVMNTIGVLAWLIRIYPNAGEAPSVSFSELIAQLKLWREWLPQIAWHSFALSTNRFFVALFNPVDLRISSPTSLDRNIFFAIYDTGFFIGDFISRRIFYPMRIFHPIWFLIFSIGGGVLSLVPAPLVNLFGGFLVAFANGAIYAQSTKKVETEVRSRFNLMSFSVWLIIGDVGSVIGANLTQVLATLVNHLRSS
ncbi:hypothetical protein PROFUN_08300 [Planoprotostelium fungivorum]|uniref:Uncharacterized protein n=1 Tax=Planoprotostelium fungivorum TaxID=1890364 RepID=A0A2P6NK01_9EUKA|nr:hypothetical protein PROFUN_08300 [Planoprotostelium fungivorum]